jgi:hypothetical protein
MMENKVATLRKELDSISRDDVLYWKQGINPSGVARAEYQRRQDRRQTILKVLADLVSQTVN